MTSIDSADSQIQKPLRLRAIPGILKLLIDFIYENDYHHLEFSQLTFTFNYREKR